MQENNGIPAYCNLVTAGSRYDLVIGSVVTGADDKFVGTDSTLPVALNYAINVRPYTIVGSGTSPAMGSSSSFVKAAIREGRGNNYTIANINLYAAGGRLVTIDGENEGLTYSESSSASGTINSFSNTIGYQSGKVLL